MITYHRVEAPEHRRLPPGDPLKPIIHNPEAMLAKLSEMRANPARYVGGPHLIAVGEAMMRRGGFGHLVDADEPGVVW